MMAASKKLMRILMICAVLGAGFWLLVYNVSAADGGAAIGPGDAQWQAVNLPTDEVEAPGEEVPPVEVAPTTVGEQDSMTRNAGRAMLGWDTQFGLPGYAGRPVGALPSGELVTVFVNRDGWHADHMGAPVAGRQLLPGLLYAWTVGPDGEHAPRELLRDVVWRKGKETFTALTHVVVDSQGHVYITGPWDTLILPDGSEMTARGLARWDGTNWSEFLPAGQDFSGDCVNGIVCTPGVTPIHTAWDYRLVVDSQDRLYFFGASKVSSYDETAWQWDGSTWHDITPANFYVGSGEYQTIPLERVVVGPDDSIVLQGSFTSRPFDGGTYYKIVRYTPGIGWDAVLDANTANPLMGYIYGIDFGPEQGGSGVLYVLGSQTHWLEDHFEGRVMIWKCTQCAAGSPWVEAIDFPGDMLSNVTGIPSVLDVAPNGTFYIGGQIFDPNNDLLHGLAKFETSGLSRQPQERSLVGQWVPVVSSETRPAQNFACDAVFDYLTNQADLYAFTHIFRLDESSPDERMYVTGHCPGAYGLGFNHQLVLENGAWRAFGRMEHINGIDWASNAQRFVPIPAYQYFDIQSGTDGMLYVAGGINQAGPLQVTGIAQFNPYSYTWDALGLPFRFTQSGSNARYNPDKAGMVADMAVGDAYLFVAGTFNEVAGQTPPPNPLKINESVNLAQYHIPSKTWQIFDVFPTGLWNHDLTPVIATYQDRLYVAGNWGVGFAAKQDDLEQERMTWVLVYDPTTGEAVPLEGPDCSGCPDQYGNIKDIFVDPATGHVYLGGIFTAPPTYAVSPAAVWDGSTWTILPPPADQFGDLWEIEKGLRENELVHLVAWENDIFIGWYGALLRWDGTAYEDLTSMFNLPDGQLLGSQQMPLVRSLAGVPTGSVLPPGLLVGGSFSGVTDPGRAAVNSANIIHYAPDTGTWTSLAGGVMTVAPELSGAFNPFFGSAGRDNLFVSGIAATSTGVYLTGSFMQTADGKVSHNIARLYEQATGLLVVLRSEAQAPPAGVYFEQPVTYTVTVLNRGPEDSTNLTLEIAMPLLAGVYAVTPVDGSCEVYDELAFCTLDVLPIGATWAVEVTWTPYAGGPMEITARATGDQSQLYPGEELAVAVLDAQVVSDLAVGRPGPVLWGLGADARPITFTYVLTNYGPTTAPEVSLSENWPESLVLGRVISQTAGALCDLLAGVFQCALGSVPPGEVITMQVVVTPTAIETYTYTLTATGLASDPDPANNVVTVSVQIAPAAADLVLEMGVSPAILNSGQVTTVTLNVLNQGPFPAAGAVITLTVPVSSAFVQVSSGCGFAVPATLVICPVGALGVGASATLTVPVVIHEGGVVTLTAAAGLAPGSGISDNDPWNNSAVQVLAVSPAADLVLEAGPGLAGLGYGTAWTTTLRLINEGPHPAGQVVLTATAPMGIISGTLGAGNCQVLGGGVTCAWDSLAVNAVETITLTGRVTGTGLAGLVGAVASAGSAGPSLAWWPPLAWWDPYGGNNRVEVLEMVSAAQLTISQTVGMVSGGRFAVEVGVTNAGPDPAVAVVMTYTLPVTASYAGSAGRAGCTALDDGTETQVICLLGDIAVGETAGVTLNWDTPAPVTLLGITQLGSQTTLMNPAEAVFAGAFIAVPTYDVALSISGADIISSGETAALTIQVFNQGALATSALTLTYLVPAQVVVLDVRVAALERKPTSSPADCTPAGEWLLCSVMPIPAGESVSLVLGIQAEAPGWLYHTGYVFSAGGEFSFEDNLTTFVQGVDVTDLAVTFAAEGAPEAGAQPSPFTTTLTLHNLGDFTAAPVTATIIVSGSWQLLSADLAGPCPTPGLSHSFACTLNSLDPGETQTLTLHLVALDASPGGLEVIVRGPYEFDLSNNIARTASRGEYKLYLPLIAR